MEYIILIVVLAVLIVGDRRDVAAAAGRGRLGRGRGGGDVGQGTGTGTIERGTTTDGGTQAGGSASGATTTTVHAPAPPASPAPPAPPKPVIEKPPPSAGRMVRLRARLARSQTGFGSALLNLLSRDRLDDDTWDEIEEVLITADVGVAPARQIVEDLETKVKVEGTQTPDEVRADAQDRAARPGRDAGASRALRTQPARGQARGHPRWSASTARGRRRPAASSPARWSGTGDSVLLGAADTFRAAAADQLQTWGDRVGAEVVRSDKEGADPASVAFEAVSKGIEAEVDVVLIDTAGRLHTKTGLMDELGKVKRVIEKSAERGRGAAGARRHHGAERAAPGPGVRRGGRRLRHRADEAGRDREGRHRDRGPARARRSRSSSSASARGRTTWRRSIRPRSSTRSSASRRRTSEPETPP